MTRPVENPAHLPTLDGLRGAAAMAVVIGHSAGMGFLSEYLIGLGQLGVTTFFALSGFLMAHLYLRRDFTVQEVATYTVARFARIVPLYWLVAGGASVLLYVIGTSLYGIMDFRDVLENLLFIRGDGVFWSIPVEVHFYVVFPLLWWCAARGWFWPGLLGILAMQAIVAYLLWDVVEDQRWLVFWLHIFFIGGAVSWVFTGTNATPQAANIPRWCHALAWICFALVLVSPAGARKFWDLPLYHSPFDLLTAGLALALLLCAVLQLGPSRYLDQRVLTYLGKISFGIYLLHVPFLIVARELGPWIGHIPLAQFALVTAGTIIASHASFVIYEAPIAKSLRRMAKPAEAKLQRN